jgi:hypothetical protein
MKTSYTILTAAAVWVTVAIGQGEEAIEAPRKDVWRVRAGWVHQWGRDMEVRGSAPSYYRSLLPRSGNPRWAGKPPPGEMSGPWVGRPGESDWNFDDGYVFPDEESGERPGGDPANPYSTHYWHYTSADQYDAENHTLTFHRDMGMRTDGAPRSALGGIDENLPRNGINVSASRWLHTWEERNVDLDLLVGLTWFPKTKTLRNTRSTDQNVVRENLAYTYFDFFGDRGWQPELGSYGYGAGGYWGEYSTLPGDTDNPILPLEYDVSDPTRGLVRDTARINGKIWRLRGEAGPTFTRPLTERLSLYLAPQFVLEYVKARVYRTETVTLYEEGQSSLLGSRSHKNKTTRFVPGVLLSAGATYLISEHWHVGASVGYEWLSRDVSLSVGPDTVNFDLKGGECSLFLSRQF